MSDRSSSTPSPLAIIAAFAAIYTIWGSTYLAIRVGVETMPPFTMAAARFITAGALLYTFLRYRGVPAPNLVNWRAGFLIGGLLLLGGNGCVSWAEQYVDSGVAALLIAAVPFWMVLVDWIRPGGVRPGKAEVAGLVVGFIGVVILINPTRTGPREIHFLGAMALILASLLWATGSVASRYVSLPRSPLMSTSLQMLGGGALLLVVGLSAGEWGRLDLAHISVGAWFSLGYLIVFGSLVAFSAYVWLLRVTTPARVSTYAYVNPAVAVILGAVILGEVLTARTFLAMGIIILAVILITTYRGRRTGRRSHPPPITKPKSCVDPNQHSVQAPCVPKASRV